jgi:hypothetical protein
MLNRETRLRRNEEIAAKVMDGEAIIINLSSGVYYSADKAGGRLWALLEAGYSLGEMVDDLVQHYGVDRERATADVQSMLDQVVAENLARVDDTVARGSVEADLAATGPRPYEPPLLNVYRDMNDLLALDPPMPGLEDIPWKDPSDEQAH